MCAFCTLLGLATELLVWVVLARWALTLSKVCVAVRFELDDVLDASEALVREEFFTMTVVFECEDVLICADASCAVDVLEWTDDLGCKTGKGELSEDIRFVVLLECFVDVV